MFAVRVREGYTLFSRLFRFDSPFWLAVGRVSDVVIVNLLGIVFSLPLVTIGASITAATDVIRRQNEDLGSGVYRMFVTSFRRNFRGATLIWAMLGPSVLLIAAFWFFVRVSAFLPLQILLTVVVVPVWIYVWALEARFANPPLRTIRLAFIFAFGNIWLTVIMAVLDAALLAIAIASAYWIPQLIPLVVLFGHALVIAVNVPFLEKAFAPFIDEAKTSR